MKDKNAAHKLAFLYYQSLKLPEKRTKKDDILPLIEACYHACKAGEYDEAADIVFDHGLIEDLDRWGESKTLIELYIGFLPEEHLSNIILLNEKGTHGSVLENLGTVYSQLG